MSITTIIIQSIAIFIVAIMAVLLYALPSGKKKQNLPFCLFLLIICLHILTDLTINTPAFGSLKIHLLPGILIFLYGPLLYMHFSKIVGISIKRKWIHFLPVLIFFFYYLIDGFDNALFFSVYGIQYAVYTYLVSVLLIRNRKKLTRIKKNWISFVTYTFGAIWLFVFIANISGAYGLTNLADNLELVSYIIATLFFVGLVYFSMSQPVLFMNVKVSKSNQDRSVEKITPEEQLRMNKIRDLFENEKLFKDPELNRDMLAGMLQVDHQTLSREINLHFKMNLPELINYYRIEEAKVLLTNGQYSIKEVYYDIGFNSRSAFNVAFKKNTGRTPSEFKAENKVF